MKLVAYYSPMSSATRILWALEELSVPYEKVKIDLAKGEQRSPEYLALNPNGKVPLLVADGTPIFESVAILCFLGETFGVEKGLFPAPGIERAMAFKWMTWAAVTVGDVFSRILRNTHERYPEEQRNLAAAAAAKQEFVGLVEIIEQALLKSDYLVGGKFTFADLPMYGFCAFASRLGAFEASSFPHVKAWMERCARRPALLAAQAM